MLTSHEIRKQVLAGNIHLDPFHESQLGPNSYDLRIAKELYRIEKNVNFFGIDTSKPSNIVRIENVGDEFELMPDEFYLARSIEYFGSEKFIPTIHGRSTTARHGLLVHLCAGFCDLGWYGHLVFELKNITKEPMSIKAGVRIAQVAFEKPDGEIDKLYRSTYQDQDMVKGAKGLD